MGQPGRCRGDAPRRPYERHTSAGRCYPTPGKRFAEDGLVHSYFRKVWAIARKDLLIELRSRDVLSSAVVFTLLVLLIFNFALDLTGEVVRAVAPGVLWVTFIFAGMLTLGRTFARERERGALQGLLLAPLD